MTQVPAWNRTGPIVAEVTGDPENLRVVDYAVAEALRADAELVLVAQYAAHGSFNPMAPGYVPKPPAELADDALRAAVAHVRHRNGYEPAVDAGGRPSSGRGDDAGRGRHP